MPMPNWKFENIPQSLNFSQLRLQHLVQAKKLFKNYRSSTYFKIGSKRCLNVQYSKDFAKPVNQKLSIMYFSNPVF